MRVAEEQERRPMRLERCTMGALHDSCAFTFGEERASPCVKHLANYVHGLEALARARESGPVLDLMRIIGDQTLEFVEVYNNCEASWGSRLERLALQGPLIVDSDGAADRAHIVQACIDSKKVDKSEPMNQDLVFKLNAFNIMNMYSHFAGDLRRVRAQAKDHCNRIYMRETNRTYTECRPNNNADLHTEACSDLPTLYCQLSDVEAELTYLRIRALKPNRVFELSPFRGWSTFWLLSALRDNGKGTLHSFDIVDAATRTGVLPDELTYFQVPGVKASDGTTCVSAPHTVPLILNDPRCSSDAYSNALEQAGLNFNKEQCIWSTSEHEGNMESESDVSKSRVCARRWFFTLGDAAHTLQSLNTSQVQFDYLFIDSLHTADFAQMYLREVFDRQQKPVPGSVHDCYNSRDPRKVIPECKEVKRWLKGRRGYDVEKSVFTSSIRSSYEMYATIMQHRWALNISSGMYDGDLQTNSANTMMFFDSIL